MSQKSSKRLRRLIRSSGAANPVDATSSDDTSSPNHAAQAAEATLDRVAIRSLKKMYAQLPHCDRAVINRSMDVMAKAGRNADNT